MASIMKVIGYPNSYFFDTTITIDNKKIPYRGELKIQKKSEDMHIYGVYPPQSGVIGGTGTEVNGFYFVNKKNNVIAVFKFSSKSDMSLVWKTYYSNVRSKAIKDFILKYDKEHKTNYYESIYPQK